MFSTGHRMCSLQATECVLHRLYRPFALRNVFSMELTGALCTHRRAWRLWLRSWAEVSVCKRTHSICKRTHSIYRAWRLWLRSWAEVSVCKRTHSICKRTHSIYRAWRLWLRSWAEVRIAHCRCALSVAYREHILWPIENTFCGL